MLKSGVTREDKRFVDYYKDKAKAEVLVAEIEAQQKIERALNMKTSQSPTSEKNKLGDEGSPEIDSEIKKKAAQSYKTRKPFTENLIRSEAFGDEKQKALRGKARQQLFGADEITHPDGFIIIKMLDMMDEQQLLELNYKICKHFEHE